MTYQVLILRRAQKELAALPKDVYARVRDALRALGENPRPTGCLKLTGREGGASASATIVWFMTSMTAVTS